MENIRETKKEATELTTWPATLKVDERKAPRPFFREGRTLPTKVSKLSSKIPEYSWLSLKNEKTYLWNYFDLIILDEALYYVVQSGDQLWNNSNK